MAMTSGLGGGASTRSPTVLQVHASIGQYPYIQDHWHRAAVAGIMPSPEVQACGVKGETLGITVGVGVVEHHCGLQYFRPFPQAKLQRPDQF
jgi:hypothetical protein